FSLGLPWLPVGGMGSPAHLVLPALTLSLPSIAMVARMTRSSVLEVLREDYVRTARAKGLAEQLVVAKHALRNALIPIITLLGLQAGQLMGGAVLTETVFAWPGLGRLMVKAIFARDYVLLQGAVLLFAVAFVFVNLIVDLSYGALDPRISRQGWAIDRSHGHRRRRRVASGAHRRCQFPRRRAQPAVPQPARPRRPRHRGAARDHGDRGALVRAARSDPAAAHRQAPESRGAVLARRRRVRPRHPL